MIRPITGINFDSYTKRPAPLTPSFRGGDTECSKYQVANPNGAYYFPDQLDHYGSRARAAISDAIIRLGIDKDKIKSICDFGCGTGRPTTVLKEIFGPDCDVIGIDSTDKYLEPDKKTTFKHCNGIEYLESGERKFDLITAQMLDPDVKPEELFKAAYKSLNKGGQLLVYSDSDTMRKLIHYAFCSDILHSGGWQVIEMPRDQLKTYGTFVRTLLVNQELLRILQDD